MPDFNPSGSDVTRAVITSHDGSLSTDISNIITEYEIIQSIEAVSYLGTITVFDTVGLLEKLRAEETLDLTIASYDLPTEVSIKAQIYKVSDIVPSESNNGVLFVIHFVSQVTFKASTRRVIKSYKKGPHSIAEDIFDEYFSELDSPDYLDPNNRSQTLPFAARRFSLKNENTRSFVVQPTGNFSKMIIPDMKPTEAMRFLTSRSSAGSESPSQTFRFFETLENFYYVTDEFLISNGNRGEILTFFYAPASSIDPANPTDQVTRIENLRIISRGLDIPSDMYSGAYKSSVTEIDLIRGVIEEKKFDYSTDARYIDMSGNPRNLADNPHTESFRNATFTDENAKKFLVFKDYSRNGDIPSPLHTERFIPEIVSNRISYYQHLNATTVSAGLKGRLDLRPGMIINLDIKRLSSADPGSDQISDTMSGLYLIKLITHHRDARGTLHTTMQLAKFDWSRGVNRNV